jgi:ubiquinone/menaquinone biosynthesis C-methylase UbiE
MLADRGLETVGIDPNEDMLAEARGSGGPAEYRRGDAEATGLPDHSAALVTVAQAFHWLDLDASLAEIHRVLRPGGHAAALWNIRGEGPFMSAYDALLRRFSTEYEVLKSWVSTLERLKRHPRVLAPREHWETHAQHFDLEQLRGRAWSSSYVFRGVEDRHGFDAALAELFGAHVRGGVVEFPYRTVALVFRVGPA